MAAERFEKCGGREMPAERFERCGGREIWLRGNSEECTGKGAKNQRIKASDRVGAGLRIFREN